MFLDNMINKEKSIVIIKGVLDSKGYMKDKDKIDLLAAIIEVGLG